MAAVALRLRDMGRAVEVRFEDPADVTLAQARHTLVSLDAERRANGFVLPTHTFRRGAVTLARALRAAGAEVEFDDGVTTILRTQLEEIEARRTADTKLKPLSPEDVATAVGASGRFRRKLTRRQLENLGRLIALRHGANFSVPGAGKTSTLLALYEALRARGAVDRLLVVAPKNAFVAWEDELALCFCEGQHPLLCRLQGGAAGVATALTSNPEIALITYQLLPNVEEIVKAWATGHRTQVALDESHRVKSGHVAVTAAAALDLAGVAVRRDIMSGTPLPHSPEDLRPQLDFLWPGQRVLPDVRVTAEAEPGVIAEVERAVRPLYVRTTKEELELPRLDVQPVQVDLGPLQRELYELLRSEAARAASGMQGRDQRFFRMLGRHVVRLLQAAINPMLLTQAPLMDNQDPAPAPEGKRAWELLREFARYERPAKIEEVIRRTEVLVGEGKKVLIWTQFVMNVLSLERLLAEHGAVVLYGQVPTGDDDDISTREGRIRAFHNDPETKVMIANPAAAGEGISLHRACHHALYLDRNFNAAHYLQSLDRIHRLGLQGVEPEVRIVVARETIDARVEDRLHKKIIAMSQVLNDHGLAALAYDPLDIGEGLPAGIEPEDVEQILDHLEEPEDH
ncbi:MAG TPA: DEAD/DEAH box helicase [Solirubrobacterales bacterium]|nr:DEAD/DEAH box helicase [Solirubrobacterales bacterium]